MAPQATGLEVWRNPARVLLREQIAEHRIPALGLLLGSLVLNDIPMLDENFSGLC
jgi:hypothetical protein